MFGKLACSDKITSKSSDVFKEGIDRLNKGINLIDYNLSIRGEKIQKARQDLALLEAEQSKDLDNRNVLLGQLDRVKTLLV